ncbi:LacI family DNA-binding transcriptional regulator [Ruficoccus amylovorans]|uniref:LacI family DNA-binding transcriptional regulator n=1 Tax=Ruficoccus amylovorans TaxID=1804625 RepID=A0A842HGA0_9BACT|nr:LacI family DNA-binding transcriptional regulator [Ruficoccus amylovorans]MBC2595319.1 LacI family DNA-binding transcriptional regulator [Ruficoccus amylovorans]
MPTAPGHPESDPPPAVSLRYIAERVGVSRMTVSRAFKPDSSVKPELREKILRVAKELGYEPDAMVSELMTSFAHRRPVNFQETFAALWWPRRWYNLKVKSDFDADIFRGLNEGAQLHGRTIDHIVLTEEMTPRVLMRMLHARNIQGVILTPPLPANTPAPALDWEHLSAVSVGSSLREPALNRAQASHYQGAVLALRNLDRLGYKRPCLLVRTDLEERMNRAYSAAFLGWGHAPERVWRQAEPDPAALADWLRRMEPDVVIGDCDKWINDPPLKDSGCDYISLDVREWEGPIAGIYQSTARIAMCAVDLLIRARLMHEHGVPSEPLVMLTTGIWHEGKSLRSRQGKRRAASRPVFKSA